jgi:acyl-[acyl-carrier-protein] desaturase
MPGQGMPDFRRNGMLMAKHGIYDLRQHLEEVITPVLRKWQIFERTDFTAVGEQRREQLAAYLASFAGQVAKFEEQRDRMLAREASRQEVHAS